MFVPPFSREEVSAIRFDFRVVFPEDQYSVAWRIDQYDNYAALAIIDNKHKIRFIVTTLCSPNEPFDARTAKLVLMQRACMQKDNNCMNPTNFL
jgi:hypothetical protein